MWIPSFPKNLDPPATFPFETSSLFWFVFSCCPVYWDLPTLTWSSFEPGGSFHYRAMFFPIQILEYMNAWGTTTSSPSWAATSLLAFFSLFTYLNLFSYIFLMTSLLPHLIDFHQKFDDSIGMWHCYFISLSFFFLASMTCHFPSVTTSLSFSHFLSLLPTFSHSSSLLCLPTVSTLQYCSLLTHPPWRHLLSWLQPTPREQHPHQ